DLAEPVELVLGVVTGVALQQADRLVPVVTAEEVAHDFLVAVGLHGDLGLASSLAEEGLDFLDQAGCDHVIDALLDARVDLLAVADQGYPHGTEAASCCLRARLME